MGLLATSLRNVRQMPGRLAGVAHDAAGRRGFVLTLKPREQDIRRERATSNICTNEALIATAVAIYVAALGPDGLRAVAEAGLGRFVSRGDTCLGAAAIRRRRAQGEPRALVHLQLHGRAVARAGYPITSAAGAPLGAVTSGGYGPWLQRSLAADRQRRADGTHCSTDSPGTQSHLRLPEQGAVRGPWRHRFGPSLPDLENRDVPWRGPGVSSFGR